LKVTTTGFQSSVAKNHPTFAARNFFILLKITKFDVPSGIFVLFIDVALFNSGVVVLQRSLGGRGTNIFGQWDKGTRGGGRERQSNKKNAIVYLIYHRPFGPFGLWAWAWVHGRGYMDVDVDVGTWYKIQDTRYKNASQDRKKIIGILLYFYL